MFHMKHFNTRYCKQNRETYSYNIEMHRETSKFFKKIDNEINK